jgi:hypothetical protein
LEALVIGLKGGFTIADRLPHPVFSETSELAVASFLSVVPSARDLSLKDLPLSVHAEKILKTVGVERLRDLEGVAVSKLEGVRRCGKKTIREIQTLLHRARAGEFEVASDARQTSSPYELVLQIDEMLGQLPNRNREILRLRLARGGETPDALRTIGAQFNVTGERVRQIVRQSLDNLPRRGLKTKVLLEDVASYCHTHACSLTPSLLQSWAPKPWPLRYEPEFYVRAIALMRPDLLCG